MIPLGTTDHTALANNVGQLLRLNGAARLHMLLTMRPAIDDGGAIADADWREAYGKAADFQTVQAAREVLDGVPA